MKKERDIGKPLRVQVSLLYVDCAAEHAGKLMANPTEWTPFDFRNVNDVLNHLHSLKTYLKSVNGSIQVFKASSTLFRDIQRTYPGLQLSQRILTLAKLESRVLTLSIIIGSTDQFVRNVGHERVYPENFKSHLSES